MVVNFIKKISIRSIDEKNYFKNLDEALKLPKNVIKIVIKKSFENIDRSNPSVILNVL